MEPGSKANVEMSQTVLVRRKMKEPFNGEGYVSVLEEVVKGIVQHFWQI